MTACQVDVLTTTLPHLYVVDAPIVRYFKHGQSNPTYFVKYAGRNLVLRKKPVSFIFFSFFTLFTYLI